MILHAPNGRTVIVIEVPHTGTTTLRRWAQQAFQITSPDNQHPERHATALQTIARIGSAAWENADVYATIRHPRPRAITMCNGIYHATGKALDRRLADFRTLLNRNGKPCERWWPITTYTHDRDGRALVQNFIRLEQLRETLKQLTELYDLAPIDPPHLNARQHKPQWQTLNARFRSLAEQIYAPDCAAFGYDWTSPHEPRARATKPHI